MKNVNLICCLLIPKTKSPPPLFWFSSWLLAGAIRLAEREELLGVLAAGAVRAAPRGRVRGREALIHLEVHAPVAPHDVREADVATDAETAAAGAVARRPVAAWDAKYKGGLVFR